MRLMTIERNTKANSALTSPTKSVGTLRTVSTNTVMSTIGIRKIPERMTFEKNTDEKYVCAFGSFPLTISMVMKRDAMEFNANVMIVM